MTVYMDFVIVLNFAIDFLLLVAADRLTGYPSILWRVILAAGLGGIYGGLCMIPQLRYLGATVWRIFALLLMSSIAFGFVRSAIQRGTVFLFLFRKICVNIMKTCNNYNLIRRTFYVRNRWIHW